MNREQIGTYKSEGPLTLHKLEEIVKDMLAKCEDVDVHSPLTFSMGDPSIGLELRLHGIGVFNGATTGDKDVIVFSVEPTQGTRNLAVNAIKEDILKTIEEIAGHERP